MTVPMDRLAAALADRYRLERELGQGGMATVFLAHDLRHEREVAIKVLHPELAAALGGDRFLTEIKLTARLQHPHILPLLDSGNAEGQLYYVMPFVAGETLRARLERERQLPIPDALAIAREVADALGAAHALGIIHRDIKPENILLQGGHAVVADFGIALAVQSAGGARMTQTGLSLGTPHYMSPEQAMGERVIDARSDLYALGAVTYEMLTGDPPFTGSSVQAIVARVLNERPAAIRMLRDTVPAGVEAAVLGALAKLPADRPQSASDFAEQLARGMTMPSPSVSVNAPVDGTAVRRWRMAAGAAVLVAVAAMGSAVWSRQEPVAAPSVVRFAIPARAQQATYPLQASLSTDGRALAYVDASGAGEGVRVRWLDREDAVVVPGTRGAQSVSIAPDGRRIVYTTTEGVFVCAPDGQDRTTLIGRRLANNGIHWGDDGFVYVVNRTVILRVAATGGTPQPVYEVPATEVAASGAGSLRFPILVNNGRSLAFVRQGAGATAGTINVLDLDTRTPTTLAPGVAVLGERDGWLLWVNLDGDLLAQRIDHGGPRLVGEAIPLLTGLVVEDNNAVAALSAAGTLVYQSSQEVKSRLVWVSPEGLETEVDTALTRAFGSLSLSPDGSRVAVSLDETGGASSIWSYDLARGSFTRLSESGAVAFRPRWTPDGRRVLFSTDRGRADRVRQLVSVALDSRDSLRVEVARARHVQEVSWPAAGAYLAFREGFTDGATQRDLFAQRIGDTAVRPIAVTRADEQNPAVSPDGRWIAYVSDETGAVEVYLTTFPEAGARVQVSNAGGVSPVWSRAGRTLYYRDGQGRLVATAMDLTRPDPVGRARFLFDARRYSLLGNSHSFDVTPDDTRFLFIRPAQESRLSVVVHWWDEVRPKLAGAPQ